MDNFNEIFATILNVYEKSKSIEAAMEAVNLTDEQRERIVQTFAMLEAFNKNAQSIRVAKENGDSRKKWLAENILSSAQDQLKEEAKVERLFELLGNESEKVKQENIKKANEYGL